MYQCKPQLVINVRYEDIKLAIVNQINHQILKTSKKRNARNIRVTVSPTDSDRKEDLSI